MIAEDVYDDDAGPDKTNVNEYLPDGLDELRIIKLPLRLVDDDEKLKEDGVKI